MLKLGIGGADKKLKSCSRLSGDYCLMQSWYKIFLKCIIFLSKKINKTQRVEERSQNNIDEVLQEDQVARK